MNLRSRPLLAASTLVVAALGAYFLAHASEIFAPDNAPVGYVGMPAVTRNDVTSGNERMYSIDYSTLDWSGNVHAYALGANGTIHSETDLWTGGAASQIDGQNWDTARKIVTLNGNSKVAFRWNNLSTSQQADLGDDQNILNYLRGDRTNESPNGSLFRKRNTVLGDIVHSTPVYWEDPPTYGSNGTPTASSNCSGAPCKTIFVGANDGMLHALDAGTGSERFAFVPAQLLGKMSSLAETDYTHQYFVDGPLAIRTYDNQSILVGSLGGGGMGLFALDVSNPNASSEANAATKILWEISNSQTSFANLGHVYGKPALGLYTDGTAAAFVGNGYNNTGNGLAALFIINAKTGAKIAEISTGSGSTSSPNGLSSPTLVDTDLDGRANYAYAGDIDGNLWKFDLNAGTASRLFTTTGSQAITMAPAVTKHTSGGYMLVFATGKLFTSADEKDTATHYAYGIWDGAPSGNTALVAQTLTERNYASGGSTVRVRTASANVVNWNTARGWQTALPIGGERVVGGDAALITQGVFRFLSSNPTINPTATVPGDNWWVELNPLTGAGSGIIRFDLNGDTAVNAGDLLSDNSIPVARSMGGGIRSQLITLFSNGYAVYHANYDRNGDPPSTSIKGVAGGHFDVEFYSNPAYVCSGEASASSGSKGKGSVRFSYGSTKTVSYITIKVGSETVWSGSVSPAKRPDVLDDFLDGKGSSNYTLIKDYGGNSNTVGILATANGAAYNGTVTVTLTTNGNATGYTITNVTGGSDPSNPVTDSSTQCDKTQHVHEYDDAYDKTGINMLNASSTRYNLSNAIGSSVQFKVLAMNQYLSPAAMLNIGRSDYDPASANGYVMLKDYQTGSSLDIAAVPSYTLSNIGSLALNLPVDAFDVADWWGNGDRRNGLHSSSPQCVYYGTVDAYGNLANSSLADLYTPVVPPANGTNGAGSKATTTTASSGARHNGALTVQIIKASTPQAAIEPNVVGRPEYGYRVKQAYFYTYVLAEYSIFWHHPRRVCFHDSTTSWYNGSTGGNGYPTASSGTWNTSANMAGTGWTKDAPEDTSDAGASRSPAAGSTDPKLGTFGSIQAVIGSSGSASSSTGSGSGSLYNVVTGGEVVSSSGGSGSGTGTGTGSGTGSAVAPSLHNVYGLSGRAGRINWRELFP